MHWRFFVFALSNVKNIIFFFFLIEQKILNIFTFWELKEMAK